MTKDRLPWFPCFPEKLLGALAGMEPDDGYLYVILLLRVYEVGGPVREDLGTLSRRSGFTKKRVEQALASLISSGKILEQNGLYSNEGAIELLAEQKTFRSERIQNSKRAAKTRWNKSKQNQLNDDAPSIARALPNDANINLNLKEDSSPPAKKRKVASEGYSSEFENHVWQPYPRKRNTSKANAWKKWLLLDEQQRQQLKASLGAYVVSMKGKEEQYIPHLEFYISRRIFETVAAPAAAAVVIDVHKSFDRKTWENLSRIYASTSNWHRDWGPEPGELGCMMPLDLLARFTKIVNSGLTSH